MENFETGDKVKIVWMDTRWNEYVPDLRKYLGVTGIVGRQILTPGHRQSRVNVAFDNGDSWWFNPDWLELVEKKQKGWTGKVMVVYVGADAYYMPSHFTPKPGQVYTVEDGHIKINSYYSLTPFTGSEFSDIRNWFRRRHVVVLEFKGFCENGKD